MFIIRTNCKYWINSMNIMLSYQYEIHDSLTYCLYLILLSAVSLINAPLPYSFFSFMDVPSLCFSIYRASNTVNGRIFISEFIILVVYDWGLLSVYRDHV